MTHEMWQWWKIFFALPLLVVDLALIVDVFVSHREGAVGLVAGLGLWVLVTLIRSSVKNLSALVELLTEKAET